MIKKNKALLIFLQLALCLLSLSTKSQDTKNPTIRLYEFREPFFNIPFNIDTLSIHEGSFSYTENVDLTRCLYFDYGPFQCYFYAEPGREYTVTLPDYSGIDLQWKNNPYFTPFRHHVDVRVKNQNEENVTGLNVAIRDFDREYDPFLTRQALRYYNTEYAKTKLDSFINANYNDIKVSDPGYFFSYREYKKAILEFHINQHNLDYLIDHYLVDQPVRFEIPSYRIFFSLALGHYFDYLGEKEDFQMIYHQFTKSPPGSLKNYLTRDSVLQNDTILNLVILNECYKAFYSGNFSKKRLISLADTIGTASEIKIINHVSSYLLKKFTYLQPGYGAPSFTARDIRGEEVKVDSGNDKLVYLGFCNLNSTLCLRELEYLKYLHTKHNKFIRIITVIKAGNKELEALSGQEGTEWGIISWDEWPEIAELYKVRALPAFFLIDRNGTVLRNPAPNPSENFEHELFLILRAKGEI